MPQQHLLSINFHIIYKLLFKSHCAYYHDTDIPREINKAIFKSESTETHNLHQIKSNTTKESSEFSIVLN